MLDINKNITDLKNGGFNLFCPTINLLSEENILLTGTGLIKQSTEPLAIFKNCVIFISYAGRHNG